MDEVTPTPYLPPEIITNILKMLPVKSLLRFQCVCKHWENLIKTPSFIQAHLHHSTQHRPSLLFSSHCHEKSLHIYLLDHNKQISTLNIPVNFARIWIECSCNGLLCLGISMLERDTVPSLLLWNPTFRDFIYLPRSLSKFSRYLIGFGFSTIVNDYKIVILSYAGRCVFKLVEVYSLVAGSWKNIEFGKLEGLIFYRSASCSMKGAIFWVAYREDFLLKVREYVVVSFDIATEVFDLIPAPTLVYAVRGVYVTQFENNLAFCAYSRGDLESCLIELWVLEEATWIFTKKYTVSCFPSVMYRTTFWRNEIAYIDREGRRTIMSNSTNTELKVLFDHPQDSFHYAESLVPISNIPFEEFQSSS